MTIDLLLFVALLLILNIASFAAYLLDKRKAKNNEWRTPESTLLLFGLIGPFGAVAGMEFARHKTQKIKFKLNYVFLGIHIILIVLALWNGWVVF